jgi:hypothetical protein
MRNPAGYLVEGTTVENDDVEWLSLERLSTDECKRHFSHIVLKDLDLNDVEGLSAAKAKRVSRLAFTFEQMWQFLTMHLEL